MAAEDDDSDWKPEIVPKSPDEVTRIRAAVRANFLFQHLNEAQLLKIFDVMKRVPVSKSEVVIRQGDQGDWFYVVDDGEYVVTLQQNGKEIEIVKGYGMANLDHDIANTPQTVFRIASVSKHVTAVCMLLLED